MNTQNNKVHSKKQQQTMQLLECIESLQDIRILQRNSLHLIGLPQQIADVEVLSSKQFFGQYGSIRRISIRKYSRNSNNLNFEQTSHLMSIYVTYSTVEEASLAILSLNGFAINNSQIRVSYGLTRYCSNFLRGQICQTYKCDYVHQIVDVSECCSKTDANFNKKIKKMKLVDIMKYMQCINFDFQKYFYGIKNKQGVVELSFFPNKYQLWKKINRVAELTNDSQLCFLQKKKDKSKGTSEVKTEKQTQNQYVQQSNKHIQNQNFQEKNNNNTHKLNQTQPTYNNKHKIDSYYGSARKNEKCNNNLFHIQNDQQYQEHHIKKNGYQVAQKFHQNSDICFDQTNNFYQNFDKTAQNFFQNNDFQNHTTNILLNSQQNFYEIDNFQDSDKKNYSSDILWQQKKNKFKKKQNFHDQRFEDFVIAQSSGQKHQKFIMQDNNYNGFFQGDMMFQNKFQTQFKQKNLRKERNKAKLDNRNDHRFVLI